MSEIHLFIIWEKAQIEREHILSDLFDKFNVKMIKNIKWRDENFSKNLTRFYGFKLPPNSNKEKHCGKGFFTLVVVEDILPFYGMKKTSSGIEKLNINIFDKKTLYRSWTGGGHKIHATNNILESKQDLMLLTGLTLEEAKLYPNLEIQSSLSTDVFKEDLIGTNGYKNFEELLKLMNQTCNYVILRNFEKYPEEYYNPIHNDIDLLVENLEHVRKMTNSKPSLKQKYRVRDEIVIDNKVVYFDLRHIGDDYYSEEFQKKILSNKIFYKDLMYIPSNEDYFYSLIYHALIHKKEIKDDYWKRINDFRGVLKSDKEELSKLLNKYMKKNEYLFTEPKDLSVYYNLEFTPHNNYSKIRMAFNYYNSFKQLVKRIIK